MRIILKAVQLEAQLHPEGTAVQEGMRSRGLCRARLLRSFSDPSAHCMGPLPVQNGGLSTSTGHTKLPQATRQERHA